MNKFLSQAIEARSVDYEKTAYVNRLTLRFRDRDVERNYCKDIDLGFSAELCCSLLLLVLSTALQVSVFPRTFILLLLFLTAFAWIASILMLMLAARLKWILWDLSHSFTLRLAIIIFTIVLLYSVGQVNVVSGRESERAFGLYCNSFWGVLLFVFSSPVCLSSRVQMIRTRTVFLTMTTIIESVRYPNTYHYQLLLPF